MNWFKLHLWGYLLTGRSKPVAKLEKKQDFVRIGYLTIPIYERDSVKFNGMEVDGLYENDCQDILLSTSLKPQPKVQVLLHEIIHGIDNMYGLGLTEEKTDLLAIGLTSLLKDNPEMIKTMLNQLVDKFDRM